MRTGQRMDYGKLTGELIVPAVMLIGVAVYWLDAAHLSFFAKAFPLALTAVLVLCLGGIVIQAIRSCRTSDETDAAGEVRDGGDVAALSLKATLQKAMIVVLPAVLIFFWDGIGGLLTLWIYALVILFMLGERRWIILLLFPAGTALAAYFLFHDLLYVRIPDGLLSIGF